MTALRPPVPYYGSKQTVAERIVRLLPEHTHYVEPYCGSLAVLLAKPRSRMETVNDLDRELMTWWRMLRDRPDDLERVCALTPHSRAELAAAHKPASDDLERARRVWVRLTQGRSARITATGWSYSADPRGARGERMPVTLSSVVGRIPPAAQRIAGVSLECRPALDVIADYGQHDEVLLYVDPPYLAETRNGVNYRHEMPHEPEHRALAEALHACRAAVVLSGYPSALYDADLYAGWHRHEIATQTTQGGKGKPRTEVLWSNRPFPVSEQTALDIFGGAA